MPSPKSEFESLAARVGRLEKLERENRLLKRGGLAALVIGASLIAMGQARPGRTLDGQSFTLTDAGGGKRAELVLESATPGAPASPVLRFFDARGEETLSLSSNRMELTERPGQSTDVVLDDAKGVTRLDMGLTGEQSFMLLNDAKGAARLRVNLDGDTPYIALQDAKELPRLAISLTKNQPLVGLDGADGSSAALGSTALITPSTGQQRMTPAGSLVLFDKDGNNVWSAP